WSSGRRQRGENSEYADRRGSHVRLEGGDRARARREADRASLRGNERIRAESAPDAPSQRRTRAADRSDEAVLGEPSQEQVAITDLNEVAARHEARAKAAREKAAHKQRMKDGRVYRAAERMAASLERYAKFTASDPVSDACTALAL